MRPLLLVVLALTACDRGVPPLSPEDAVDCSLAHGAAMVNCNPDTVDPLADPRCGDAMRAVVRACVPRLGEYRDAVAQRDAANARRKAAYFAWVKAQRDFQLGLVPQEQETRLQQEYRAADLAEDLATTTTEAARRQACAAAERELRRLLGDAAPAVLLPNLFDLGDA